MHGAFMQDLSALFTCSITPRDAVAAPLLAQSVVLSGWLVKQGLLNSNRGVLTFAFANLERRGDLREICSRVRD
jgi:hypothetical protein